jgi:hypothetical protein
MITYNKFEANECIKHTCDNFMSLCATYQVNI